MSQNLEALVVQLQADIKGFQASLSTAAGDVKRFSTRASDDVNGFQVAINRARNQVLTLAVAWKAISLGKGVVEAGMQVQAMSNRMQAATGDARIAGESMAFVRAEANRLGLDIRTTADGFSGFAASALRAGLTFQQTKEIFTGVSEAATSMHLPAEQVSLVFKALEQIAGKGTVSMEELRGQLGDALPGAFEIAAKAMGKTTAEFSKMVANGEVMSADFLPKFGSAVRKELGGSVEEASKGAQAAFNRMGNAFFELQSKMADSGFLDAITKAVEEMTSALSDPATIEGLKSFASMLGDIVTAATKAASAIGGFYSAVSQRKDDLAKWDGKGSLFDHLDEAGKTRDLRGRVLAEYTAKQKAMADGKSAASGTNDYTLGKLSTPLESEATKKAREKAVRLRDQLRGKVESIGITNAGETDPAKQAALEAEKQQKVLEEALEKKAITEQEYRDASMQNEMSYQQKLTDIRQKATDLEVGMREKALDNIQGLLQVFAGKNKAIAIAMLAFDKARAIAQAVMETHVAAAAALKYDPTGATSAHVTMLGYANVAAIAATGIAQLASMGAGGGGGAGGSSSASSGGSDSSSNAAPAASNQPTKNVYITLNGRGYTKTDMRDILDGLNDVMADGSRLNIVSVNG